MEIDPETKNKHEVPLASRNPEPKAVAAESSGSRRHILPVFCQKHASLAATVSLSTAIVPGAGAPTPKGKCIKMGQRAARRAHL